jgi:Tfp pilus assembly protein PilN
MQNTYTYWTVVLDRLDIIIPEGITITGLSIQSDTKIGTLNGIAATRDAYYELDKTLQSSQFIKKADLPISLLKGEIQFSISITFTPEFFTHET